MKNLYKILFLAFISNCSFAQNNTAFQNIKSRFNNGFVNESSFNNYMADNLVYGTKWDINKNTPNQIEQLLVDFGFTKPYADKRVLIDSLENINTSLKKKKNNIMIFLYLDEILKNKIEILENKGFVKIGTETINEGKTNLEGLNENRKVIHEYLERNIEKLYTYYAYRPTSKQKFKGLSISHDNDFLTFPFIAINQDRDYTGGFNFEFFTDFFKTNLIDKKPCRRAKILGYQSISLSGEGYTPDIRFDKFKYSELTNPCLNKDNGINFKVINDPEIIDKNTGLFTTQFNESIRAKLIDREKYDRPFASTFYFSLNKYRMPYDGYSRFKSSFKIGSIGSNAGGNIQKTLHKDLTASSPKPYLWDRQIAQGGRLSINYTFQKDIMLISKTSNIFNRKKYLIEKIEPKPTEINLYGIIGGAIGSEIDALDFGFGISNKHFQYIGGNNEMHSNNDLFIHFFENMHIFSEIKLHSILHNAILDGKGMFRKSYDDPSDSRYSSYVIKWKKDKTKTTDDLMKINPFIPIWSIGINKTFGKVNISYSSTYRLSKEFDFREPNSKQKYNFRQQNSFYGFGKLKFNYAL